MTGLGMASDMGHHRLGQCGVGDQGKPSCIEHLVMPPFIAVKIPSGSSHQAQQEMAVAGCFGYQARGPMVGFGRKGIELSSHVERAAISVYKGKVHGHAPRMR